MVFKHVTNPGHHGHRGVPTSTKSLFNLLVVNNINEYMHGASGNNIFDYRLQLDGRLSFPMIFP